MKKLVGLLIPFLALTLSSCMNNSWETHADPANHKYYISYKTVSSDDKEVSINYQFDYSLKDFDKPSTTFNKSIALLSFAKEMQAISTENMESYYHELGFGDICYSNAFVEEVDKDSIGFAIAHYDAGDYHLISVATNGMTYKKPWANNFVLGLDGDAEGFVIAADQVIKDVKDYIKKYSNKPIKFWISGFSRTGAVADIVSYRLIDDKTFQEKNLFAYTFEAPQAVSSKNTKQYNSIFNILNSGDFVTHIAPSKYDLKRIGKDVDLANKNINKWLSAFDKSLALPEFTADEAYSTESELVEYVLSELSSPEKVVSPYVGLDTREHYVNYHQEYLSYIIGLFFGLQTSTLYDLLDKLSNSGIGDLFGLLGENGIYNFLKPVLDANDEPYDDAKLKASTNYAQELFANVSSVLTLVISMAFSEEFANSFVRCALYHRPDVVLVSLYNYVG